MKNKFDIKHFYKNHFRFDVIDKISTVNGLILILKNNITAKEAQKYFDFNRKGHKIETPNGYFLNEN